MGRDLVLAVGRQAAIGAFGVSIEVGDSVTQEISGDQRLPFGQAVRYLLFNLRRLVGSLGRGPKSTPFFPAQESIAAFSTQSPSRLLTEAFLSERLAGLVPSGRLSIVEIGCGSGFMSRRMSDLGISGSYLGLDIGDRFAATDTPNLSVRFQRGDAHAFETSPDSVDLLFSFSALEHIPRDADLIRKFEAFMRPGGVEIHIVPAGAALFTYLWHGYRQYTPVMIAERFPGADLTRLGGLGSLLLHMLVITPEMAFGKFFRSRFVRTYQTMLRAALKIDRLLPVCPTSFVVVRRH
ncbi:class I SAM-dependent methyltransferase [Hyphomicrobium sp.]|uniref:class I SAM-dependent methyltransferase n=1 Tax=Hyphomicrobium sp. TaxID=82 RepID=UPI0025B832AE|nr:class I SAM-dependent methyltransferase [Hyphomicrobium sp.]MCC7252921.1 class I SAM-dependent methyltransferase [Hyphomicrobium sp.]